MRHIQRVTDVSLFLFPAPFQGRAIVCATGMVSTSGWTGVSLAQRFYIAPPADGIWAFDFYGDPPVERALDLELPVTAWTSLHVPPGFKGVRVEAETNDMVAQVTKAAASVKLAPVEPMALVNTEALAAGHVIVRREIASYDDSFQPIGMCSVISVRMKKLHHTLTLVVEGPDEGAINDCINRAATAGLIAAIIAALVTGGAALQAAVSAFLSALTDCLGASYSARIENHSHWVEWCT